MKLLKTEKGNCCLTQQFGQIPFGVCNPKRRCADFFKPVMRDLLTEESREKSSSFPKLIDGFPVFLFSEFTDVWQNKNLAFPSSFPPQFKIAKLATSSCLQQGKYPSYFTDP